MIEFFEHCLKNLGNDKNKLGNDKKKLNVGSRAIFNSMTKFFQAAPKFSWADQKNSITTYDDQKWGTKKKLLSTCDDKKNSIAQLSDKKIKNLSINLVTTEFVFDCHT
jgi:hypothetical protein